MLRRRDDAVSFQSDLRENDPHNVFLERQILAYECQQNALEFSDGFQGKKRKHFDSAHERYGTREFLLNLTFSEGLQLREWRISYHCNVLGKMF